MRHAPAALSLLALLVGIAGGRSHAAAPYENVSSRLDALFTNLHERGLFDGAVVVGNPDAIVWKKGFGYANRERQLRFTPETPTDSGSLAKTFTAALLLLLQGDGRLDLDDPAARFLPELPYADVTLRHLLSHSSGLPVHDYDFFDKLVPAGEVRTTEVLLRAIASAKPALMFRPGTRFEYSSFGFDLAGLAAARAAATSLGRLFEQRLFRPARMSSPFLRPGRLADFPGVRTLGYRRIGSAVQLHDVFDLEAFHGGSNIYISAVDLHRWNMSFLRSRLLDRNALRQALQLARIGDAPSGLTLGSWYRSADGTSFWYSGHLQGFHNEVFRDTASRRSIVYVSNNTLDPWLQKAVVRAIAAIQDGRDPAPLVPPATAQIGKEDHPRLAGWWTLPGGDVAVIAASETGLAMSRHGVSYRMVQVRPDAFYVPGLDFMIGFDKPADGRVRRMYVSSNLMDSWQIRADPPPHPLPNR